MYKKIKINDNWSIAFEKFNKYNKESGSVFKTGIRNWDSDLNYTYSLVIGLFRILIYRNNNSLSSCNCS